MKNIFAAIMLFTASGAMAQSYVDKIAEIAAGTLTIGAERAKFTADSLSFRRGLNPDDPQVSADLFLNGNVEMRIEQQLDFPTVYAQRAKLSKLGIKRAEVDLRQSHIVLMSQISEQYISLIHYNRLVKVLTERSQRLKSYVEYMEQLVASSEVTKIDLVGAATLSAEMKSELVLAISQRNQCRRQLAEWGFRDSLSITYPSFMPISRSQFIETAQFSSTELEAVRVDSMIAQRSLKLSRNEWIPKFKIGYRLDVDDVQSLGAVAAGFSIPLWQNRGNIKHSKAMIASAQAQKAATQARMVTQFDNLYTRYEAMDKAMTAYPLSDMEYLELLKKSLQGGVITSTDFLLSVIERYNVEQRRMELEMERTQARSLMEILMMVL